jgi:hypothetical protein
MNNTELRALPFDVRKVFDLPESNIQRVLGATPRQWA